MGFTVQMGSLCMSSRCGEDDRGKEAEGDRRYMHTFCSFPWRLNAALIRQIQ